MALWKDQLIGQKKIWPKLAQVIQNHRFPHFSLICGRPGNGQLVLALSLAQSLLCKSDNAPCGSCEACYKSAGLIHPDLHFSFPLIGSDSICTDHYNFWRNAIKSNPFLNLNQWLSHVDHKNKQANISAKECRSIIERLYFKPFESDRNVLILWLPELLGKESNILLKILEEPPGHSYIIMVTEDMNNILATVKSRAQQFSMETLEMEDLAQKIQEVTGKTYDEAFQSTISSEGNFSEALQLSLSGELQGLELIKRLFQKAYLRDGLQMLEWTEEFSLLSRDAQKQFLAFFTKILSLILNEQSGISDTEQHTNSILEYVLKISKTLQLDQVKKINDFIDELHLGVSRNANVRILMLNFIIKISAILHNR
ncbi:MAG: hypothetical protein M3Q56_13385 [Bacteroidota bacterium]|nr:hypothetical protein [Bacteroidota bacterium]